MALASQIPPPIKTASSARSTTLPNRRSASLSGAVPAARCSSSSMTINANEYPCSACHGLFHRRHQLLQGERLRQKPELRPIRQALFESIFRVTRDENDLDIGIAFAELLHQCRPIHFRHDHIGNNKVDLAALSFELFQRLEAVARLNHSISA